MKIGILTVCFNEKDFIVPCIKQFEGFDFDHLILVGSKPWHGDFLQDETWILAKQQASINPRVIVEIGEWKSCADQFNHGMEIFTKLGYDWVIIVDTDEFYTAQDIGLLLGQLKTCGMPVIKAANMNVYWKTPRYTIIPKQHDQPVVAVRSFVRFQYIRSPYQDTVELFPGFMYHMSYVRSNADMLKKIHSFEHQHEFDKDKWYKEKWLAWNPDMEDLHPVVPRQFKKAIHEPAHPEILRLLNG